MEIDNQAQDRGVSQFFSTSIAWQECAKRIAFVVLATVLFPVTLIYMAGYWHWQCNQLPPLSSLELDAAHCGGIDAKQWTGNTESVLLSECGRDTIDWKLELLREAKQSIEMSFNFAGGLVLRKALEQMHLAMAENPALKVHLLLSNDLMIPEDQVVLKELKEQFGDRFCYLYTPRKTYLYPSLHTEENHVKTLIVDGKYFAMGSSGMQGPYYCKADGSDDMDHPLHKLEGAIPENFAHLLGSHFIDADVIGRGESAHTMRMEFFKLFGKWEAIVEGKKSLHSRYFALNPTGNFAHVHRFEVAEQRVDNARIKVLSSHPEEEENSILDAYIELLEKARPGEWIDIPGHMFNPGERHYAAMVSALERGVNLSICTNGPHKQGPPLGSLFYRTHEYHILRLMEKAEELQRGEVVFHKDLRPGSMYHRKMEVGKENTVIGSYNISYHSERCDDEMAVQIDSAAFANHARAMCARDRAKGERVGLAHLQELGWKVRLGGPIKQFLIENFCM